MPAVAQQLREACSVLEKMETARMIEPTRQLRDRAHVVCVECHARKVKCDLQDRPDKVCTNCRRVSHTCIRRDGVRKKRRPALRSRAQPVGPTPVDNAQLQALSQPESVPSIVSSESREPKGFISPSVVLNYQASPPEPANPGACLQPPRVRQSILALTEAAVLPRPAMLRALEDAFFQHVHPFYPIVEEADLDGPEASVMLQQAVCLAGSLMQHDPEMVQFCRSQYEKIKTLVYLNYEDDNVALLKTLCLLTCFSALPSDQVTLDGPWHWSGMAIRLAIQMGLHKNFTYRQYANPGGMRRIFWQLVNTDRMTVSCWGRPSAFLRLRGCDVPPLAEDDFPTPGRRAKVFLQGLKLSAILESITDANLGQSHISADDATKLVESLCDWTRCLPEELQLCGPGNIRRAFWRPSVELHIMYFAAVILLQLLDRVDFPWRISASSFAAASCIARLYEEIYCREETARLLNIHGFFCMAAAVPLICYPCGLSDVNVARKEDIATLRRVLGRMRCRYGGADLVLRKVTRLQEEMKRDDASALDHHLSDVDLHSMPASSSIQRRVDGIFPFPQSFCGALDLLSHGTTIANASGEGELERDLSPLSYDNYLNLADLLAMDCPVFDLTGGDGGFGIDFRDENNEIM